MINKTYLGVDVGSTTVKMVVLDKERRFLAWRYQRSLGKPRQTLLNEIEAISQEVDLSHIAAVGMTGSGGAAIGQLIGGHHVNELVAQTRAVGEFYPQARTVIEIGGQDSKFLSVTWDEKTGKMVLVDMAMNNLCAAGTGSFLDQQAERLGISIEEDFAKLALQSQNPARIAGRCTVFAKSDMIHLQQKGTSQSDIIAGLAMALVRNFKSIIGKGKSFTPPILFQGGVAYNQGVVRAFETVLKLKPGELIIPKHHHLMAALGTALIAFDEEMDGNLPAFKGFAPLEDYVRSQTTEQKRMPILPTAGIQFATPLKTAIASNDDAGEPEPVFLGIDVGSITTKVVLIDEPGQVVARRYWHTEGKPLEVVRRALFAVAQEVGERIKVMGVGVTGSGRYLTADFVGGDVVRNEITAQARAAIAIDPTVDTIFEVGGQDSKYISMDNGAVVNFAMNNACAAGTGSFLEEQAEKLKIRITQDFSEQAFSSQCPVALGDRCTVFMESDLVHHQQQGADVDDLTAGLAYAIAENYLNRVVETRPIGKNIFFQGGVAWNNSVVSAFSALTKRQITVPPHHDVTGAIGAALLAKEDLNKQRQNGNQVPTKFRGFDLRDQHYESQTSICQACANLCEVNKVIIGKEHPIFYGARCDIFEEKGRGRQSNHQDIPDLFAERHQLLMGDYTAPTGKPNGRLRVGIPRSLIFYDMFPYWRTFFKMLDIDIVLSEATNPNIAALTKEHAIAETCYPAKLVYGHVAQLLNKDVNLVFLPSVINRENIAPGQTENNYCPYIPAMSHLVTGASYWREAGAKPLTFPLHLLEDSRKKKNLHNLAKELGVSAKRVIKAEAAALTVLHDFYAQMARRGQEVLADINGTETAVIVGRPYTINDLGFCQNLPYKLRKMGVMPLPMDYLPLKTVDLSERYNNMFWRSGQDILAAATLIRDDPRLQAIYLTCFSCGPDSFIINFFRRLMVGKPFLELELDDHTADAGILTRCEAFFESLKMGKSSPSSLVKKPSLETSEVLEHSAVLP